MWFGPLLDKNPMPATSCSGGIMADGGEGHGWWYHRLCGVGGDGGGEMVTMAMWGWYISSYERSHL